MKLGEKRIEIHGGPDDLGRYRYTLFWVADYHLGDPAGEHRMAWRAQEFFARLTSEYAKLAGVGAPGRGS